MAEQISETKKNERTERQDIQENGRYSLRYKVCLIVSLLGISLSLIISRSIPNTSSLFFSNLNLQLSYKAADSFPRIEEQSITENSQGTDEGNESVNKPRQSYYRVRKAWADENSQIGAFINKENALQLAKEKSGYKVYDPYGKEISLQDGL